MSTDALVALDGLRVTPTNLDVLLGRKRPGETVEMMAFRRDELMRFTLTLAAPPADSARLTPAAKPNALRRAWLGG